MASTGRYGPANKCSKDHKGHDCAQGRPKEGSAEFFPIRACGVAAGWRSQAHGSLGSSKEAGTAGQGRGRFPGQNQGGDGRTGGLTPGGATPLTMVPALAESLAGSGVTGKTLATEREFGSSSRLKTGTRGLPIGQDPQQGKPALELGYTHFGDPAS